MRLQLNVRRYGEAQLRLAHKSHARVHGSEVGGPRFFGLGARKLRRRSADRWRGGAGGRAVGARRTAADSAAPPRGRSVAPSETVW